MAKLNSGILLLGVLGFAIGCSTGVDPSPNPGIVRVTLRASGLDTSIIIQNDTSQFSRWDMFNLFISQGRVYRGDNYAPIYASSSNARIPGDTVNIIGREWLDGTPITTADTAAITPANSRYRKYVVFESYVPPGTYDNLQVAVLANEMIIYIPKHYQNPVQLPAGASPSMDFPTSFSVAENHVTQIDIEVFPFQSLSRYKDSFLFDRKMTIVSIQNL
jgi:hypothetical protein